MIYIEKSLLKFMNLQKLFTVNKEKMSDKDSNLGNQEINQYLYMIIS
jgi:hypothetical protein